MSIGFFIFNLIKFQYIICCWFKYTDFTISVFSSYFNTLYVVGSTFAKPFKPLGNIISIHYMLLVQHNNLPHFVSPAYFNTLYVVGSRALSFKKPFALINFNTLYVVGSNFFFKQDGKITEFQYIICCWFKRSKKE